MGVLYGFASRGLLKESLGVWNTSTWYSYFVVLEVSGRYNWSDTYEKEAPSMEVARVRVELEDSVSKKFYLY